MNETEVINAQVVSHELGALSLLLSKWTDMPSVGRRIERWHLIVPKLRDAITAGLQVGGGNEFTGYAKRIGRIKQLIPSELVEDERELIRVCVKQLMREAKNTSPSKITKQWLSEQVISNSVDIDGQQLTIKRAVCVPKDNLKEVVNILRNYSAGQISSRPSELVYQITAWRCGRESGEGVKRASGKRRKFGSPISDRSQVHKLLASMYVELVSYDCEPQLQAHILDILYLSNYHILMLYYLTQWASMVPPQITGAPLMIDEIKRLCVAMESCMRKPQIFTFTHAVYDAIDETKTDETS